MKTALLCLCTFFVAFANAQDGTRIKQISDAINTRIQGFEGYADLSADDKQALRAELIYLKDLLDNLGIYNDTVPTPEVNMTCLKRDNGRYYPVNLDNFQIMGDDSYNASYPSAETCKATLPQPGDVMACAKRDNGRFYPVGLETFEIIGDSGYNASYPSYNSCRETLPKAGDVITCAKKDNGRFYPVQAKTLEIIGDTGYNASYPSMNACLASL